MADEDDFGLGLGELEEILDGVDDGRAVKSPTKPVWTSRGADAVEDSPVADTAEAFALSAEALETSEAAEKARRPSYETADRNFDGAALPEPLPEPPSPKTRGLDFLGKLPAAKPPSARTFELYDDASDGEEAPPLPRPEVPEEGEVLSYSAFLAKLALPASSQLAERVGNFIHRAPSSVKIDQCSAPGQAPSDVEPAEFPSTCSQFFDAAEAWMGRREDWQKLGEKGLSSARSSLEKYVLNKIGDTAFDAVADADADARLQRRCRALATFLRPEHLDIHPKVVNEVVLELAAAELRRLDALLAPADKVECVVRCASMIFSVLNLARAEDSSARETTGSRAGADDFLPVVIYVVAHAGCPRLHSNAAYIQTYHNPAALMSKAGYCFANLQSAIAFVESVQGPQLGMTDDEFASKLAAGEASLDVAR